MAQPTTEITEDMMERTFARALEYGAAIEISLETALTHFLPETAAALGAYAAIRAPKLLAQRSPHLESPDRCLPGGFYHPGDDA